MTLAQTTSLEALLGFMQEKEYIPLSVIEALWSVFTHASTGRGKRHASLTLLTMLRQVNLEAVMRVGLGTLAKSDVVLASLACRSIQSVRLLPTHVVYTRITELLVEPSDSNEWFLFAQTAIQCVYSTCTQPDAVVGVLLKKLGPFQQEVEDLVRGVAGLLGDNVTSSADAPVMASSALAHVLFVVGSAALSQLAYLDRIEAHYKKAVTQTSELQRVGASAEDEFTDAVARVKEHELLYSSHSLLALYAPVVVFICANNTLFQAFLLLTQDETVQAHAVLCLVKLMCVSSKYCSDNLQLLLTILKLSPNPRIKSNIILGLCDITTTFNTIMDQNTAHIYVNLANSHPSVRKNTLMVLSLLILNGMIKVKGHLHSIATTLLDPLLAQKTRLFLAQLHEKDPQVIYNNVPDIISNLDLPHKDFKTVMAVIIGFISRQTQIDALIDKLASRLLQSPLPLAQNLMFCMSIMTFSEKSVGKLNITLIKHVLHDDLVYAYAISIIQKVFYVLCRLKRARVLLMSLSVMLKRFE